MAESSLDLDVATERKGANPPGETRDRYGPSRVEIGDAALWQAFAPAERDFLRNGADAGRHFRGEHPT